VLPVQEESIGGCGHGKEGFRKPKKVNEYLFTGHTGWTDDLDFAFLHRRELCKPFAKKYTDPSAPYDGYVEDDDTEEGARSIPLTKVRTEEKV